MTTEVPSRAAAMLFKGGPSLIDLLVDDTDLRITVTGPGMLFQHLDLLTTLSPFDGCTVQGLREFAGHLEGTVLCGLVGTERVPVEVVTDRAGGTLRIGLGPANMYQSELVLRTTTGETLRALARRLLTRAPDRPFFAGLHAVPATGHMEHGPASGGHPPDHPHGPGHGHSHGNDHGRGDDRDPGSRQDHDHQHDHGHDPHAGRHGGHPGGGNHGRP
ncbi:hypothetical protein ACF068_09955 [Streptomyces sp. NPDC016309]|uniref:hypothetical protein n=1 Tax=Streptomyces sp. NPDC016309 TaxID=3364965 RepID=UPI0036F833EA